VVAPKVSVVAPMHNARPWIAEALDSILAQTMPELEVLLIDDGSTDGSDAIGRAYASRDPRVRYLRQDNAGPSAARNAAIRLARAPFTAFLDSDDRWLPTKLARQLGTATRDVVVYGDAYRFGDAVPERDRVGRYVDLVEGDLFDRLLVENIVPMLTVVAPTGLLRDYGGFDEQLPCAEDLDLWLRMSLGGVRFVVIQEPLAEYRVRADSLSRDDMTMIAARVAIFRKLQPLVEGERADTLERRLGQERRVLRGLLRRRALKGLSSLRLHDAASSAVASLRA
jgi:glycosyltransferase involved in cell wall biosynthesis